MVTVTCFTTLRGHNTTDHIIMLANKQGGDRQDSEVRFPTDAITPPLSLERASERERERKRELIWNNTPAEHAN